MRPDWNALQDLLALARAGSLERAAALRDVDASTVSRRVRALEAALGARIFDRTAAGHRLTALGGRLVAAAERVEAEVASLERQASQADRRLSGPVRLSTSDAVGRHLLAPLLERFRQACPLVELQLAAEVQAANLVRREADLALRLSRPRQQSLRSRRLGTLGHALYAAPGYLERRPFLGPERLAGHDLVGYERSLASMPEARWLEERATGARFSLRANRVDLLLEAAASGFGLAVLPCYAAAGDGRLVRLLGADQVVRRDLWLVLHRDARRTARIRALADFLARELGERAAWLAGDGPGAAAGSPAG